MTVHNMRDSLEKSVKYADAPWWAEVYREAFPTFQGMVSVRDDGAGQRNGIDRHISVANGRTYTVDEKVREDEYNDFFLEYRSSVEHKTDGWVVKDLACDFIAYAFVQSGRCYLLPFPLLRRAWKNYGPAWTKQYPHRDARNRGYTTRGCCVPIDAVLAAVADTALVRFTPTRLECAA